MSKTKRAVVLISGVAGMTGARTAEMLLSRGYEVVGFDNFFAGSRDAVKKLQKEEYFHFFEEDLCNPAGIEKIFNWLGEEYADSEKWCVHCAAVVHTKHFYHPDDTFEVNVVGTRHFLEKCIEKCFKRFINCSTSEVYSMRSFEEGGVKENDPILLASAENSLRTSYATGKLLGEFFMRDAVEKKRIMGCSIRFANVYAENELWDEHIIPHIITCLEKNHEVSLLRNAKETMRSFLHNDDSSSAVIALLLEETALDGSVYNVGTHEEINIVDLVHMIARMMQITDYSITYTGERSADPKRRLLCTKKIEHRVHWRPHISLEEGLRSCLNYRKNR